MITVSQLKKGASFYSPEFQQKIIVTKDTLKMVWYLSRYDYHGGGYNPDKRITKDALLTLLNSCDFHAKN